MIVNSHHKRPLRLGVFRRLTSRQLQLVRLVNQGEPYREIGERMGITEQGVRQHLHRIYGQLHVRSRAELMALYVRMINGELEEE